MYRRVPPPSTKPDPLSVYRRLTPRDRLLMSWLAEHYLLSAAQVGRALFTARRTAQQRLTILHRLGVLHRFAWAAADGTPETSYLYTLGPVGLRRHPTAFSDPDNLGLKAPRSSIDRAERIVHSRRLHHLLGVNQFFVDLHAHTRAQHDTRLLRWWSEQHATAAYSGTKRTTEGQRRIDVFPDGHGIWHADGATIGFFVEHDRDTEDLARVVAKLRGYEHLARYGGPRFPVLLWVPHQRRETSLLRILHDVPTRMPVALAVHNDNPAGPVWALTSDPIRRRHLHELPSDPGPDGYPDPFGTPLTDDIDEGLTDEDELADT
ncbi:replication-relaxation family protein [Plantactinospora sp. WMMB334]|uniref:replication-relaxation family protein n=1 Tax=Plantactinospora sp. WMMB334 TaxID=3404119 RepID=UPI003B92302F